MDDLFLNAVEQESKSGSPSAACRLGNSYRVGEGVEKNERMAADWYIRAALAGSVDARSWLGTMMNAGRGVPADTQALCADLKARADSGDGVACCLLGMVLREGWGCEKDYDTANAYFTKGASELGHLGCMNNLGVMYNHGLGFVKDASVAVEWFRKAAEQGDAPAQYNLALMIYEGAGVDKNPDMATEWFRKAAEQGYAPAQCELAIRYEAVSGGVPRDNALAVEWYRKAIEQGDLEAHFRLGLYYYRGVQPSKGIVGKVDEVEGWRKAAEQGDAEAQFQLGGYYNGLQSKENFDIADAWYRKAAEGGDVRALKKMADRFSARWNPDADYSRAIAWYMRAAEQGDYRSCISLGGLYRAGKGVEKDEAQGVMWVQRGLELFHQQMKFADIKCVNVLYVDRLEKLSMKRGDNIRYCLLVDIPCDEALAFQLFLKAAEQGHVRSMYMLGNIYQNGRGVEENQKEAFKWYLKAAENQSIDAQLNVGLMYQRGLGVERNEILALQWLQQAADNGHAGAQCQLGGIYRLGQGVSKDIDSAVQWYKKAEAQGCVCVTLPLFYVQDEAFMQWHRTAMDLFRNKRCCEALDALGKSMRHPPYEADETKSVSMEGIDDVHVGADEAWNRCASDVSALRSEGKFEEARDVAKQALKLAECQGEGGLADVATSLNMLGEVYYEMKDLKMAKVVFQRSLALRVRTLGRYHPEVAECIQNIEATLKPVPLDEETHEQCRALSTLALRIRVKAYGRNHPLVALSLRALARAYLALHDHEKSLSCARNAADIYEKTLGESHVMTLDARRYVSVIQDDLDELEEMIRLERENPLAPDDVAGLLYRWSSRSPRLAKERNGEE